MVSLSSVGCGVFLWLGVMDQRACDQLVKQEASLDTLMWLKLLSVPTLGIIILTLFLLEEYFNSYAGDHEAALQQAAAAAQQAQLQQQMQQIMAASGTAGDASGAACVGSTAPTCGDPTRKGSRALLEASSANGTGVAGGKGASGALPGSTSPPSACGGNGASGGAAGSASQTQQSYPHPLTLLSPARVPVPCPEYPLQLPSGAEFGPLCNPQDLLAGAGRAARLQATMAGAAAAQGAQTLLLGAPAHFAPCPSASPHSLRVNLMNEAGVSTVVTCPSSATTIKELMVFYAAKNNCNLVTHAANSAAANSGANGTTAPPSLSHSLYTFSYHGRRIDSDKATLLSVGLVRDMDILHVSLDYTTLHANLRREMAREISALRVQAAAQEDTRDREEKRWKERMEELERVEGALASAQSAVDSSLAEKARVQAEIESTKARIVTESAELQRLHKAKLCAEGSDADRIEHKRYEKLLSTLTKEHAALAAEVAELAAKAAKVEREKNQLLREIATVDEKNKHMEEETVQLAHFAPPEMQAAGESAAAAAAAAAAGVDSFPPMTALVSQLERLERAHVEFLAVRKKIDMITGEIAHKRAEIHALSKKVSMSAGLVSPAAAGATGASPATAAAGSAGNTSASANGGVASGVGGEETSSIPTAALVAAATSSKASTALDHSLPSLRARALALERETKDLLRWKTIAKHLEMEGKESARWKALWKAAGAREAALQAQLQGVNGGSSAAQWRLRARAFEKEVRELQAWKRALALQQSSAVGVGPASPLGDFYAAAQPSPLSNITYDTTELPSLDASGAGLAMAGGGVGGAGMGLGGLGGLGAGELQMLGEDGSVGGSAAAAAAGLILDDDSLDLDGGERIEPQARHLVQASSEEEERTRAQALSSLAPAHATAAALAGTGSGSNGLVDSSDPAAAAVQLALSSSHGHGHGHGHPRSHERISAELLAAEAEEERLVQSMRLHTNNGNGASSLPSSVGSSPSHSSVGGGGGAGRGHSSLTSSGGSSNGDADEEELLRLGEALVRRNQHLQQHRLMVRYQQQQAAQQAQQMQRDMETIQHMQAQQAQQQEQMHNYASKNGAGVGMLQASAPVFTPRFQSDAAMPLQAGGGNSGSSSGNGGGGGGSGGGPGSASKLASHYTKVGSSVSPFGAGSGSSRHTSPSLSPSPPNPALSWNSPSSGGGNNNGGGGMLNLSGSSSMGAGSGSASGAGAVELDPSAYWLPRDDAELDSGLHSSSHGHNASVMRDRSFSNPAHSHQFSSAQQLHSHHSSHMSSLPPSHPHAGLAHNGGASASLLGGLPPLGSVVSADPFTAFRRSQNLIIVDDDESASGGGSSEPLHTLSGSSAPFAPQFGGPYSGTHAHFGSSGPPSSTSRHPSLASAGSAHVSRVHSGATSPVVSTLFGGAGGGGLPTFFSLSQQGVAAAANAASRNAHAAFHQHDSHS